MQTRTHTINNQMQTKENPQGDYEAVLWLMLMIQAEKLVPFLNATWLLLPVICSAFWLAISVLEDPAHPQLSISINPFASKSPASL